MKKHLFYEMFFYFKKFIDKNIFLFLMKKLRFLAKIKDFLYKTIIKNNFLYKN